MSFVHLHVHTQYSLLDGANKIKQLLPEVKRLGMPAVAMTDHGNMFGTVEFYQEAVRHGVQPLIGCEVYVASRSRFDKTGRSDNLESGGNYHLTLLAMNQEGYRNLCALVSRSYVEGFHHRPRIDKELLAELNGGLIALSGCLRGEVSHYLANGNTERAHEAAIEYARLFPDRFYVEVQDNKLPAQERVNGELQTLAARLGVPVVATNDCHYLRPEDAAAHEVLLCIQTGKTLADDKRWRFETNELFLKTPGQMAAAFAGCPEAVTNTLEVARRCDLELTFGRRQCPTLLTSGGDSLETSLQRSARDGLARRLAECGPGRETANADAYEARLGDELRMIIDMGFAGYFLIVADFINYARRQGIPVGPGRGSAAGSLVAYALGITDIDPLPYGLLFERFLNPGRKSMPDIDVDFCFERRDEIIRYVRETYGPDRVAQIVTFGTLKGKQAIKDVGRVLGFNFSETDRIAKLYPAPKQGRDYPLEKALEIEPRLRDVRSRGEHEERLFQFALGLEGLLRHASKHAAGVVISDRPLVEDIPLMLDKDGHVLTQYSGPSIDAIGLVKFDFLALKNLTLLHSCIARVHESRGVEIGLACLPLDDPKTYDLLARGDTVGVFQMESSGMRKLLTRLRPTRFEDVIAVLALFRPGPLDSGMVDQFIKRKHGKEPIRYPHPALEPILNETYGVIVYQEQVMQIAQALAGYSLAEADNLRRAMGKKKKEVMAHERARFLAGCSRQRIQRKVAANIWNHMETFAAYGFNKAHSTSYAFISYQTAYLKAHYPVEFLAALLTLEMGDTDKVYKSITECRDRGILVLPPDINESRSDFTPTGDAIRFGLSAVKGVGTKAVEVILGARDAGGPFRDLSDLCRRVRSQQVNRRVVESLIRCGAFDSLGATRAQLLAGLEGVLRWATQNGGEDNAAQIGLFGSAAEAYPAPALPPAPEWSDDEKLRAEKETLGFFVTAHPLDKFAADLSRLATTTTAALRACHERRSARVAGVVQALKLKNSRRGDRYATFALEDKEGIVEVIVWPDVYRRVESVIQSVEPVCVSGTVEADEERCQVIANDITPLSGAQAHGVRQIHFQLERDQLSEECLRELRETLARHRGDCPAFLHLVAADREETVISLPSDLRIAPTPQMIRAVEALLGAGVTRLR